MPLNRRRRPDQAAEPPPLPASGRITALQVQARHARRISVFVDGEFALGLDAELAAELGLAVGQEITRALLETARGRDAALRARTDALVYLGARARTRQEVERRLADRGHGPAAIAAAVQYLLERRYLDDAEYARLYIRQRLEGRDPPGRRRLETELLRRGVPAPLAREAVAGALADADPVAPAVDLLRRRLERAPMPDRATAYRRLGGLLARRGYDPATIARALQIVLGEWELPDLQDSETAFENHEGEAAAPRRSGLQRRQPPRRSRPP